jgi:adenosylcobinamide-GDP ribazoletransferase
MNVAVDFITAVRFLTRVPMPRTEFSKDSLARSVVYFPLVGALVGGAAVVVAKMLGGRLGLWLWCCSWCW